jgi:hypothetical protein
MNVTALILKKSPTLRCSPREKPQSGMAKNILTLGGKKLKTMEHLTPGKKYKISALLELRITKKE